MATNVSSGLGVAIADIILCDDNGPFIRKFIQDSEGVVSDTVDITLEGAPYVPVGTVSVCPAATADIDSTVQRQTGAGNIVIAAGARSVTVVVISGNVTVNLGQGVTTLPFGMSATWSVDTIGETLSESFTFTGVAGSDFIVTSTREL